MRLYHAVHNSYEEGEPIYNLAQLVDFYGLEYAEKNYWHWEEVMPGAFERYIDAIDARQIAFAKTIDEAAEIARTIGCSRILVVELDENALVINPEGYLALTDNSVKSSEIVEIIKLED